MEKKNACAFIPTFWIHYLASLWMLKSDYGIWYANWNENKLYIQEAQENSVCWMVKRKTEHEDPIANNEHFLYAYAYNTY